MLLNSKSNAYLGAKMFLNTGLYFYIHVLELLSAMTNIIALTEFHGVFVLIVGKVSWCKVTETVNLSP